MKSILTLMALSAALFVAACGVDGEPERPDRGGAAPGISISGTAAFGIAGGS